MTLPTFDPQSTPRRRLSQTTSLHAAPPVTRIRLRQALALDSSQLLRRDASSSIKPRQAAVLLLLIESAAGFEVVFTERAAHLRHHAGQISFVGGALEADESPLDAALREAWEEVGLSKQGLEVLGELPLYHTITGFAVTPIVAVMSHADWAAQSIQLDAAEVARLFTVPLAVLLNHDCIDVHEFEWHNQSRQYFSVTHNHAFIWGASMAMLRNLDILLRQL
ncbi:MAG: NUDIX hydrolase [Formosimonas sp.]